MRISDWSSDVCSSDLEVTQGFGRTHHSDQVQPPVLTIVSCDLPADKLYASRIVSALFKLGALTQGHRHAASNGMFDERDCLDGPYALGAWEDLQAEIADGAIPNYSWEQIGRAHVRTPVTNEQLVCLLLLETNNNHN